jgi:hypothetical protein
MGIGFVDATYHFSSSGSNTGTEPTGVVPGDFLIAIISGNSGGGAPIGPVGWTKILSDRTSSPLFVNVWFIVRGTSAPSYAWTQVNTASDLDIVAYRGCKSVANITGQSASGSAVAPSVTTTVNDCVLLALYGDRTDATVTMPTGMNQVSDTGNSSFNYIAAEQLGTAGATGTRTFTGTSNPVGAWSVALAPASPMTYQRIPNRIWRGRRR